MNESTTDYGREGNYCSSDKNLGLALAMLFTGLAAGAITALLLAPQSGRQTRRTLRRKYEDARDAVDELGEQASGWVDKGTRWAQKTKAHITPLTRTFGS